MKHFVLFLFALLFLNSNIFAKNWQVLQGDIKKPFGGRCAVETYDKGILIACTYVSDHSQLDISHSFLIKTDKNGAILWRKELDAGLYISSLISIEDGSTFLGCNRADTPNHTTPILLKLDACGEVLWCTSFHSIGEFGASFYDVKRNNNGDILPLCCYLGSSKDSIRSVLFCLDSNGKYKWSYKDHSVFYNVSCNINNDVFLSGFEDTIYNWAHSSIPTNVLMSNDGKLKWKIIYNVDSSSFGTSDIGFPTGNNGFITIVNRERFFIKDMPDSMTHFIIKYNLKGQMEYVNSFGDSKRDEYYWCGTPINDSVYLLLTSYSDSGISNPNYLEVLKINSHGNILEKKDIWYSYSCSPESIAPTSNGNFLACSNVYNSTNQIYLSKTDSSLQYDTLNFNAKLAYDFKCKFQIINDTISLPSKKYIIDLDTMIASILSENKKSKIDIKIYPDPVENILRIQFPEGIDQGDFSIIDLSGKLLFIQKDINSSTGINISTLAHGMYIVKIQNKEGVWNGKFIKL